MKKIKYFIQFLFIIMLFLIFKILGRKTSSDLGCFIGKKFGIFFRSETKINNNIKKVFTEISNNSLLNIKKEMWCNFGRTFSEYVFLKQFKENKFNHINIKGKEILENIKVNNIPTVFVSGHFANFELMAMELDKHNMNLAAIYRPLNNIFLNPLMEHWRRKYICNYQIAKKIPGTNIGSTRDFIIAANKKKNIALMVDQSITQGEKINFFGHPSWTTSMPSQLAKKYNYQIIPVFIKRIDKYNFEMQIMTAIKIDKSIDNEISIGEKINKKIENMILENPGQWIWTHDRWK